MAHENGEFVGNNEDLYTDTLEMVIVKLPVPIEDGGGRIAHYMQTSKMVRRLKGSGEFVSNLFVETELKMDMTKQSIITAFTLQKANANPAITACLNAMIEQLENEE